MAVNYSPCRPPVVSIRHGAKLPATPLLPFLLVSPFLAHYPLWGVNQIRLVFNSSR
ncbi:hypothetical protein ROA7745_02601 [Roseovarius aestuarii]|uniref:Uncharacterized protein n=1 Tax=Roseovarius aestuarii TaxID=475083 RepID=A0A1X7BU80_9RHOB|nr:hypothetical protein ROA7745_02601 [Roseovarius aestuarii]